MKNLQFASRKAWNGKVQEKYTSMRGHYCSRSCRDIMGGYRVASLV
jgi:hypothetical protein